MSDSTGTIDKGQLVTTEAHTSADLECREAEATDLARILGTKYEARLVYLKKRETHTTESGEVFHYNSDHWLEMCEQSESESFSWDEFNDLNEADPERAIRKWESVKADARFYVNKGLLGTMALPEPRPWDRALYLAVRQQLAEEWRPQNGIERTLIDQMVHAHLQLLHWQRITSSWENLEPYKCPKDRNPATEPPRVRTVEAIEHAVGMMDRYHRMFIRAQRALRDMRRHAVIVQNAGQVNVGQRQLNVSPAGNP